MLVCWMVLRWVIVCGSADGGVLVLCFIDMFGIVNDVLIFGCSVNVVVKCCVGIVVGVGQ